MATKKSTSRKTTKKKSGTRRKSSVPKRSVRKKSVPRKKGAKKKRKKGSVPQKKTKPSRTRARRKSLSPKKRVATRGKVSKETVKKKKVVRKKPTKKERAATHGTRRKPQTAKRVVIDEVADYFALDTPEMNEWTPKEVVDHKLTFLRAFANRGIIRDGVVAAGITYRRYKLWREKDQAFADACKHAETLAADRLEGEAHRRAFDGFERPVIYQGEITETYTEYSDSLMQMLMKGYKRDKYKERQEHSGSVGRPLTLDDETKESVVSSILGMIQNKPDPKN